jgi:2-methylcitrate dehydratase PrpD
MTEGERGASSVAAFADAPAFVRGLTFEHLPDDVVASAQRSLLDLIGVAAAGSRTRAAAIASTHAATQLCGRDRNARILFDGRRSGLAGAAFAGASTIDALDGHDGHVLTKGHAGAAILPALLALVDAAGPGEVPAPVDGREFLTRLVLGYEIATRAGIAITARERGTRSAARWSRRGILRSTRRRSDTPWVSPNTSGRAARSCAPATRRRW